MNRNRKIISIILLMLMALLVFPITTFAYEGPTSEFYVNDYAEILDDDSEKFIIENSRNRTEFGSLSRESGYILCSHG